MELMPEIPGYKILKKIGEGATSTVYMGIQDKLERKVAIKILKPQLVDSDYSPRFLKEAKIASNLTHPNIVTIHDIGQTAHYYYIVMEYLGESLKDRLSSVGSGCLPGEEALGIVKQVSGALQYAHSAGVVHRDIKPGNILFRANGNPVIADFGLALKIDSSTVLTEPGMIMGTFRYMSPEQCKGERGEQASDIYSLGVLLFEMLTGKPPYSSEISMGLLILHMNEPVPGLPDGLTRYQPLIDRMMAKEKEQRVQSGEQVIQMIDNLCTGVVAGNNTRDIINLPVSNEIKVMASKSNENHYQPTIIDQMVVKEKEQRIQDGEQVIQIIDHHYTDAGAGNNAENIINLPVSNEIKVMARKNIDYFDLSLVGRRVTNQDQALCAVSGGKDAPNRVILAVADGMVGLEGEVASKTLYDQLLKIYREELPGDFQQTAGKVENCIKTANRAIYDWSQKKKGTQIGTTISGAVVIGNRCLVFNVGNSRTYLIRAGCIQRVSKDHSTDREAYEAGMIKNEDIGRGLYSNALTRSVGTAPEVAVDIFPQDRFYELKKGDIIFSCTDGLWNKVTDAEIKKVFDRNRNIQKTLQTLYKLAYKNGSKDNISMAAYRYGDIDAQPALDVIKTPAVLPAGDKVLKQEEQKKKSEKNRILKRLLFILIGILAIVVFLVIYLVDYTPQDKKNAHNQSQIIVQGGVIQFEPDGGKFRDSIEVRLSITEPLKSSQGYVIDADIYYTLDGSEPTKEKGKKYFEDKPLVFSKNGTVIIRARVIARVGKYEMSVYSRVYTFQSNVEPGPIVGGEITFLKPRGNYIGSVEVPLAYKTLRFANGNAIFGEIYYTTDGDDPTRTNGTLYKEGVPVKLTGEGKYTIKAKVFSRDGKYEGAVYSQTYTIKKDTVVGGKISFTKPGGEYKESVQIQLGYESLRLSSGNAINSDVYYTLDGSEPKRGNGKKCKIGDIIIIRKEGTNEIKARVISRVGKYEGTVYSQIYVIQPSEKQNLPQNRSANSQSADQQTSDEQNKGTLITDFDRLDPIFKEDIERKLERIIVIVDGVQNINKKNEVVKMEIAISKTGMARLLDLSRLDVEPADKLTEIKSQLDEKIQRIHFTSPSINGKPVDIRAAIFFKHVSLFSGRVIFEQ